MKLTKEQHNILTNWIQENLIHINTYNNMKHTGVIRTCFEQSSIGFYVDNKTFNQIMLDCGYTPRSDKDEYYWYFKVSDKSPAFIQYFGGN